jgi:peptidoglycan/LPS O-acetylase OafA/YrhL
MAAMAQPSANFLSGRIVELDAVRGLAAAAVMVFHLHREFWFGATGVDLFFVLSGYLISSIILANRHRPGFVRSFYARRALRIFPIYYVVLALVLLVNQLLLRPHATSGFIYYAAYLQNTPHYWGVTPAAPGLPLGHTWTLAIEEQFYLLWPFILLAAPGRLVSLCIGLVMFSSVARYEGLCAATLLGHLDGLVLGALLAGLQARWAWFRSQTAAWCMFALAAAASVAYLTAWNLCLADCLDTARSFRGNAGISIISLAYFGLIGGLSVVAGARGLAWLRWRPLIGLGTISYGLYLYHAVIYAEFDDLIGLKGGGESRWLLDAAKVAASLGLACLSWHCLEKPILRWKDRFKYAG